MTVTINGIAYEVKSWTGDGFVMETGMSLSEIESAFTPGAEAIIVVNDGEQEIGRYYHKGIESLSVSGTSPRTVSVVLNLTQITENAEVSIRNSLDTSDEAIAELAKMVAALCEIDFDGIIRNVNLHTEMLNSDNMNQLPVLIQFMQEMQRDNGVLANILARLDALENK